MTPAKSHRAGTWVVLAVLAVFLALSFLLLYVGWGSPAGPTEQAMSTSGYIAMALGIIVTLTLGVGLMALVFYSNRRGHDQNATLQRKK